MSQRHLIVGTAGHIDHGKSALVEALTGVDPDRLKEEKARGITIELGFADLDLGGGNVVSFVDVPGHERFVRRMVAGAAGIDAVLLVIAAGDGVCPQTREHLQVCSLLDVRHGLVVLTKRDLVDDELCAVVSLEAREFLSGSFLEQAPIIAVSARTGDGLDQLRSALVALIEEVPRRSATGVPRLPVDRSFVLRGFGTVVTGTLVSGTLREGDEIEVLPTGRRGRIRGLQVHHHKVSEASAGQRTAVNVQGLDRTEIPRGSTLTVPRSLLTTRRVWASVHLSDDAPENLAKGGPVRFHQGTCERNAKLRVLRENESGGLTAELRFDEETVLLPGDRFIVRRPAPVDTVGGGVVLDVRPPPGKPSPRSLAGTEDVGALAGVLVRLERAGTAGRSPEALAAELGMAAGERDRKIADLEKDGRAVRAAGLLFDGGVWRDLAEDAEGVLERFHEDDPLRFGMSREELRSRVCRNMPQEAWRIRLETLTGEGRLRLEGELVALASHQVVLSDEGRAVAERVDTAFRTAGLDPPDVAEVLAAEGGSQAERIVDLLIAEGKLVRIRDGRLFHGEALEKLLAKLREYSRSSRTIDVGTFKQLAGVTRKNAIPLLEHLDAERRTRRVGNVREILNV